MIGRSDRTPPARGIGFEVWGERPARGRHGAAAAHLSFMVNGGELFLLGGAAIMALWLFPDLQFWKKKKDSSYWFGPGGTLAGTEEGRKAAEIVTGVYRDYRDGPECENLRQQYLTLISTGDNTAALRLRDSAQMKGCYWAGGSGVSPNAVGRPSAPLPGKTGLGFLPSTGPVPSVTPTPSPPGTHVGAPPPGSPKYRMFP